VSISFAQESGAARTIQIGSEKQVFWKVKSPLGRLTGLSVVAGKPESALDENWFHNTLDENS
jgi:hypothetical protein